MENPSVSGETTDVNTGEVHIGHAPNSLRALAIGSCIVVVIYDPLKHAGGMAHVMLPGRAPHDKGAEKTRYAEDAIDVLCRKLTAAGVSVKNCWIAAIGGADILGRGDIFRENAASVLEYLRRSGLAPVRTLLGGALRRSVLLKTDTGKIFYTEGDSEQKEMALGGDDGTHAG